MLIRLLVLIGLLLGWQSAQPVAAAGAEFTLQPAAKADQQQGYFKFSAQPGDHRDVSVIVTNTSTAAKTYHLNVVNAGVSANGQLTYTPDARLTKTSGPLLPAMVTFPQKTVTIPAHHSQAVTATLTVPATTFVGERLGAIAVTAAAPAADNQNALQNRFTMAVPLDVTIVQAITTRPQLTLTKAAFAKARVSADLANHTARLFGEITLNAQVRNAAGKVVTTQKLTKAQMAPNAIMALAIPLSAAKLAPGRYQLAVSLTSGQQHYQLSDHFTITAAQAQAAAAKPTAAALPWWVYGLIALVAALVAVIVWLLLRRPRNDHRA